jgi:hypothetical protein
MIKIKETYNIKGRGLVLIVDGPHGLSVGDEITIKARLRGRECSDVSKEEGLLITPIEIIQNGN